MSPPKQNAPARGREIFNNLLLRFTSADSVEEALEVTLGRMKREILEDLGRKPAMIAARHYGDLHDYFDANEYGGACEMMALVPTVPPDGDYDPAVMDHFWTFWNEAQDAVSRWVAAGGLLGPPA